MILFKNVMVKKQGRILLDIPELRLRSGSITAILGPNGAGKSTLLKVLAGTLKAEAGDVYLFGRTMKEWGARELARSRAMLSQHYSLPFSVTVRELVLMGRYPHGESSRDHSIIDQAMREMDVLKLADRNVMSLSGGEQQRAHMARVLVQLESDDRELPKLLLLDEPVSSLDIFHQQALLSRAQKAAQEGYTVVMVLHDVNLASQYAESFLLMKRGRILQQTDSIGSEDLSELYEVPMRAIFDQAKEKPFYISLINEQESLAHGAFIRA